MNRRDMLKSVGAIGACTVLPGGGMFAGDAVRRGRVAREGVDCVLTPQETAGPYPLDLSRNAAMFRQDITEGRTGTPLSLVMTVLNVNDNCAPVANARVDIWHCDKDGVYSGYSQPGANTVGQTFMRGIQLTDGQGRVNFHTVYPGWYAGRITHIHFQIFLNSVLSATSQFAFPDSLNAQVYGTALYSGHGQNTSVANNASDTVFGEPAGDLQYELLTVTANDATGGFNGTFTIGINAPKAGVINLQPETGGQFALQQNFPNPFARSTDIMFTLAQASSVDLEVFDVTGARVTSILAAQLEAGEHHAVWDGTVAGVAVPRGNYVFQLNVENALGRFHQSKVMTLR
ncbi:MAG TPA: FlgD immunoglobulin-like domain containing protein [Candidatus Kapabacteria bacterium]|nr:FlgD immunoglobulin-like domain containing protein [Candidatus Kapabacteria bacterium]